MEDSMRGAQKIWRDMRLGSMVPGVGGALGG